MQKTKQNPAYPMEVYVLTPILYLAKLPMNIVSVLMVLFSSYLLPRTWSQFLEQVNTECSNLAFKNGALDRVCLDEHKHPKGCVWMCV